MALIPDIAIENLTALSSGAWRLYTYLAKHRNSKTALCNPSLATIKKDLHIERATAFALRKELKEKKWAEFDGDKALGLYGFADSPTAVDPYFQRKNKSNSPEIQTISTDNSPEIQTLKSNESRNPDKTSD